VDVPLKERFYYYRGKVLRFKKGSFDADQAYWALRNQQQTQTPATTP
jgi:hypothetical protein